MLALARRQTHTKYTDIIHKHAAIIYGLLDRTFDNNQEISKTTFSGKYFIFKLEFHLH